MDIKQIQELIKIINKTNISEISIEEQGLKITIKQKEDVPLSSVVSPAPVYVTQQPPAAHQVVAQTVTTTASTKEKEQAHRPADNLITIKSPMIGTFYRRSSPDKPAFVEVGTDVEPGKVVCIIEAMKLFNEIESEIKGKVVKVLVEDASPVEYDQPLFLVEPA